MERTKSARLGLTAGVARFLDDKALREAGFAFLLTRGAIFIIFIMAGAASLDWKNPGFNSDDLHPIVAMRSPDLLVQMKHTISRGDSAWYLETAERGYDRGVIPERSQHNWAFFPLYPLLLHLFSAVVPDNLLRGALLSNGFFFFALVLLHKLVSALGYDVRTAHRAVIYTAFFPVSYFFALPLPESLFLFLCVASFLMSVRGKWWAAGLLGALASATRVQGVLLLPALPLLYWQRTERTEKGLDASWLALVPIGLIGFMFFLWNATGDRIAFLHAQDAWQRKGGLFFVTLYGYLQDPLDMIAPWNFRLLNFAAAILALAAGSFWAIRKQWAFAVFTFLSVLLPLSSLSLQSMARYAAVMFPVFIALAVAGQRVRVDQTIRFVFAGLLALMTLFYALRFSFAAA